MKRVVMPTVFLIVFAVQIACDDLNDYSTKEGACYMGNIIDADFVRAGAFGANVRLKMSLDVEALAGGTEIGAVLSTDDGLFDGAPVRQMVEMTRDTLSLINFPGGRLKSYLAYAPDSAGKIADVVISLMENGDVEARIFRAAVSKDDALYGVFRLVRSDPCAVPTVKETPDASVTDGDSSADK
jgi:hypothetical protein